MTEGFYLLCNTHVSQLLRGQVSVGDDQAAQADVVHIVVGVLQGQELEKTGHQIQPEMHNTLRSELHISHNCCR